MVRMDDRGRFKIPREYLRTILETHGPEVYVTSVTGQSAWVYPLPVWEEIESRLATNRSLSRYSTKGGEEGERAVTHFEVEARFREVLGTTPQTGLEEGLARTWAWAKDIGPTETPQFAAIEIDEGLPPSWR